MRFAAPTIFALGIVLVGVTLGGSQTVDSPENFVYFGVDRGRIAEASFLEADGVVGAQIKYRWPELEPERDTYDVDLILRDLEFLERHGKRLFIQIQDVSFEESIINVPAYLREDPAFNGGVARQYGEGDDDTNLIPEGWVARRWDPAVRERFIRLLRALGEQLDGRIAGVNLPETSIGFGEPGEFEPPGYTFENYRDGVLAIMTAAGEAFPRSDVIQYANFMPGEELPWSDNGYLKSIYAHADRIGVGVGGPDLLPHRRWQQNHSLTLIAARGPNTIAGVAVQWGNLDDINPETGERVTVDELFRFARDRLRVDYIFWGTQEPHYSEAIIPYLENLARNDGR